MTLSCRAELCGPRLCTTTVCIDKSFQGQEALNILIRRERGPLNSDCGGGKRPDTVN